MAEENVDRFARGDLSPAESRELGREALQTPELFEELTYASVAKRTLFSGRRPSKSRVRVVWLAMAAAIAIAVVSLGVMRLTRSRPVLEPGTSTSAAVATSSQPVLLARKTDSNPIYRSSQRQSRLPRATGSVTSIADGTMTVDVGSLDGLTKNASVDIFRDGRKIGSIQLATIFRERARAEAPRGIQIHLNDQVHVPPPLYLRAVLDQMQVLLAQGDTARGRQLANQAAAVGDIELAVTSFEDWNNLGAIAELHGDRTKAQGLYQQALQANPPEEARRTIEMNMARLNEKK